MAGIIVTGRCFILRETLKPNSPYLRKFNEDAVCDQKLGYSLDEINSSYSICTDGDVFLSGCANIRLTSCSDSKRVRT